MRAQRKSRRLLTSLVLAVTGAMIMTGCGEASPTGDALYSEAEGNYFRYREFVNELQSQVSSDPWEIGRIGSYGMQPVACDNRSGYSFSLDRMIWLDGTQRESYADTMEQFLQDKGLSPKRGVLGDDNQDGQLIQVGVQDQGDFATLLIQFRKNGNVSVSARTTCWPGDPDALIDTLFGDLYLGDGYLPVDSEAPTDPLFFGVTPGDPQFVRETPDPAPTP